MTCVTKDYGKLYLKIFLEEALLIKQTQRKVENYCLQRGIFTDIVGK